MKLEFSCNRKACPDTEPSRMMRLPTLEAILADELMTDLDDWRLQRACLGVADVLQ